MTSAPGASPAPLPSQSPTVWTSTEAANVHETEDCLVSCEHPDHAFEGPVDLDWLMFGGEVTCRDVEYGPVVL